MIFFDIFKNTECCNGTETETINRFALKKKSQFHCNNHPVKMPQKTIQMKSVEAFTDGGCRGNPGPGGWGVILRFGDHERELNGSEPETTNNRMELLAAISALQALSEPSDSSVPPRTFPAMNM